MGGPECPGSVGRIDSGCWGLGSRGQSVEAHELMHSLGAVLPTAPNGTPAGHCDDDSDRMCYADGTPLLTLRSVCPTANEGLFDCGHDDYFHTAPRRGSYLATHWNAAASSFLSSAGTVPGLTIADGSVLEGDSGTAGVTFAVSLAAPSTKPVTVRYATADGAARTPADYVATSGTLTFAPGETAKLITVAVRVDEQEEIHESFLLNLTAPANAFLQRTQAFGTITDDDSRLNQGYWFVAADGGIFAFNAGFFGSTGGIALNRPIVGMAATPAGQGYWLVASDGGIFSFGDARFFGSTGGISLNQPIVGMAATPSGNGYWFVAADGGIFSFGDAGFFGAASVPPDRPIVGMAATRSGQGYWFAGRDGTVFAFGDAPFAGHPTGSSQPTVGIAGTPTGSGYWVAGNDGAVSAYGDGRDFGGVSNVNQPVVGMASTPKGGGYWLVARDGGIFAFGNARFFGSTGNIRLNQPIVGMTAPRFRR